MAKQLIVLTTTGRRSHEPRSVKVYAFDDGEAGLVVVASKGGFATDPAWADNLRADPRATVAIGKRTMAVQAREVDDADHGRLWALVTEAFKNYEYYQRKTKRRIPLFMLEPVEGAPSA